ncbi:unnamed protein product, partial [Arabidopsis halleri]
LFLHKEGICCKIMLPAYQLGSSLNGNCVGVTRRATCEDVKRDSTLFLLKHLFGTLYIRVQSFVEFKDNEVIELKTIFPKLFFLSFYFFFAFFAKLLT